MIDSSTTASTLERVLAALAERGPATATEVGETVGIAYPTTTPKLRQLERVGHAERIRADQRTTLWQVTDAGKAAAAALTAGTPSVAAPPVPSAPDGNVAFVDTGQQVDADPEAAPGSASAPPAHEASGEAPADGQISEPQPDPVEDTPVPVDAAGPAVADEQVAAPLAEQPSPSDQEVASGVVTAQDLPTGESDDGRGGESPTTSAAETGKPPEEASGEKGDSRRRPAQPRRRKGELRDEVLALLRRHPDTAYKVGEICKLINQAHGGAAVNKASAGAVANALDKLVIAGAVKRLDTTVATYQAA